MYHGVTNGDLKEYAGAPGMGGSIFEPTEQGNRKVFGSNYEAEYAYGKFVDDSSKISLNNTERDIAFRFGLSPIHAIGLGDLFKAKREGKISEEDLKDMGFQHLSRNRLSSGRWAAGKFIPDRRTWQMRIWHGDSRFPPEDIIKNLRELSKKYKRR